MKELHRYSTLISTLECLETEVFHRILLVNVTKCLQFPVDWATFSGESVNSKLHLLYSIGCSHTVCCKILDEMNSTVR